MIKRFGYSIIKNWLKTPIYLIVFVTAKCNSKCRHCFYWKNLNKNEKEITLDQINKFSRSLGKLLGVDLSGGEPFLREDINKILDIFVKNNKIPSFGIPTNGLTPTKIYQKTETMLKKHPNVNITIYLSLDGLEKTNDYIRGVIGSYKKLFQTYNLLKKLKKYSNFSLHIATTMMNKNVNEIKEIAELVKTQMPEVDFHGFGIMRGIPKDKEFQAPSVKELKKLKPIIFETYKSGSFYKNKLTSKFAYTTKKLIYNIYLDILKNKKQTIPCYAGKTHCVLDEIGNVYFCELLPKIGNIKEKTFNQIWNSKEAKNMRKFIKNKKCYCVHGCFQQNNVIFNHKLYSKIIKYFIKG